jgi:hypothetical protein
MSSRFITNIALAGGFVVAASQAFTSNVTGWLAFAVGVGVLAVLGVVQVDELRGLSQRALDAAAGSLAIWTIAASVVFTDATLRWLSLGEGLGFVVVSLAGLFSHELSSERIVRAIRSVPAEAGQDARTEQFHAAA